MKIDGRSSGRKRKATKDTILASTKELVARKGPYATTIRDISEASGANVAAVNYYFQSKEELVWAATQQIGADINTERSARLDQLETEANGAPLTPRQILDALIRPIFYVSRSEDGGSLYLRNIYTMRTVPYATDNERNFSQLDHVAHRFIDAIQKTFPALDRVQAVWQYEFARGSAIHMLSNLDPNSRRFERLIHGKTGGLPETPEPLKREHIDQIIEMLVHRFGEV